MKIFSTVIVAISTLFTASAVAQTCSNITEEEVIAAQKQWGDGIVAIGEADDPEAAALNHLDTLYGYDLGEVLFKPTLAAANQFRGTKDEALSYFVTGVVEEDEGFAITPFTQVRYENENIMTYCETALAMGNYYFTTTDGNEIKVEYSFGYVKDDDGQLKIVLHHSSAPYQP
ncbi:MAG: hypothetical protein ACFCBW_16095 [Candidatus Competibacterales bacterium]